MIRAPIGFVVREDRLDGVAFSCPRRGIVVISSFGEFEGQTWQHVSVLKRDHKNRMIDVSWEEICEIKEKFIGDKYAYMVFPPKDKYVNIAHVFHLWQRIDNDKVLPEFSAIIPGLGRSI